MRAMVQARGMANKRRMRISIVGLPGRGLPGLALSTYDDQDQWDREVFPLMSLNRPFGNFSELNFAQIGHGIGYYAAH